MSARPWQPFVWVGVTAGVVVAAVVGLSLFGRVEPAPSLPDAGLVEPPLALPDAAPSMPPARPRDAAQLDTSELKPWEVPPKPPAERKQRALEAYRDQVDEDRAQLGSEFADLDRLWKKGRYGGGSEEAVKSLEELVERFGDTHHANCARFMLAKHALLKGAGKPASRRQQVQATLEQLIESTGDSRCDSGAQVGNLSKFFLATQVYRHDDWDRSVETLEELAEIDNDEVDGLDVPIALRAKGILQEVEEKEQ